jgi:uncharacterized protein YggE
VAKLSEKDRAAGMAEAFQKAKTQAAELAKAAGAGLGRLTGLSGQRGGNTSMDQFDPYNRGESYALQRMMRGSGDPEERQDEALATSPDGVEFVFSVSATFVLESPKSPK